MPSVFDIADYILKKQGPISAMKLQKLVYYSQAWHLVWEDKPLFKAVIEAWANGPVVPQLYNRHRKHYILNTGFFDGKPASILPKSKTAIDCVLKFYGPKDAQWLSELTHMEDPWKMARRGIPAGVPGNKEITHASMSEYYHGLV